MYGKGEVFEHLKRVNDYCSHSRIEWQ